MSTEDASVRQTTTPGRAPGAPRPRSITGPGIALGIGLGGFVDGILLHQLLQWHHMLSSTGSDNVGAGRFPVDTVRGLEVNTVWDGLFHVFTYAMVLIGLTWLYARVLRSPGRVWTSRALWGWVVLGWGVFNLGEGLLNHHLLAIHHVRAGEHELAYDVGFLVLGALLVVAGWLLQRGGSVVGEGRGPEPGANPR